MTISGPKKCCSVCKKSMQRWGATGNGKQRWRCAACELSGIRTREDNHDKRRLFFFLSWAMSKRTYDECAKLARVGARTMRRWCDHFLKTPPKPVASKTSLRVLVLDGTSIQPRTIMMLIAADADTGKPVSWIPVERECHISWLMFLENIRRMSGEPQTVICDGQRGLLKAIREVWPQAKIQRCLIHVIRQSQLWVTQRPKTRAGCDLLDVIGELTNIRTKRQKRKWIHAFKYWKRKHHKFLTERTEGPGGRWWYTHRKLRAVRSLLSNAIPDLFRFVSDTSIPRTSNHVEGGINSRIKELRASHRGLSLDKKIALASWYLSQRQGR